MLKKLKVSVYNSKHKIFVGRFLFDSSDTGNDGTIPVLRDLIADNISSRNVDRVTYTYEDAILVHMYDTCADIEVVDVAQKVEQFLTLLSHVKLFYFNQ